MMKHVMFIFVHCLTVRFWLGSFDVTNSVNKLTQTWLICWQDYNIIYLLMNKQMNP